MLKIVICDDTPEEMLTVIHCTETFFSRKGIDYQLDTFSSADDLLKSNNLYDLYLLDVLMPGMTGIEMAEKLNTADSTPVIVFITSSLESAIDGYRVNASGFILKPVSQENFDETMERITAQKLTQKQESLSVIHNRVPVKIPLSRIQYFENKLHRVSIVMADNEIITVNLKLSQIQEMLQNESAFLRCHQSYIVNLNYVSNIEDVCFSMQGKQLIPISRNYYKECKNKYYHYRLE